MFSLVMFVFFILSTELHILRYLFHHHVLCFISIIGIYIHILLSFLHDRNRNRNKFINQIRAPGGQYTNNNYDWYTTTIHQTKYSRWNNKNCGTDTLGQEKRYIHINVHTLTHIWGGERWERSYTYIRWFITNLQKAPSVDAKRNKVLLVSGADWPFWYRNLMWKERGETHKHVILFGTWKGIRAFG
jgi:hypothetical protein